MQFSSEMRGGCNKCVMVRGMNNKLGSRSSRMRKRKNVADGRKKES
jgi:hypothetical protein